MNYTTLCVSESGSFSNDSESVEIVKSIPQLKKLMRAWITVHEQVGSDTADASIWVKRGIHESIDYPDFIITLGKRGGIYFSNV